MQLQGIVMLTLSSVVPDSDDDADQANPLQFGLLFASLAVISLGTGGIKPNVSAFGKPTMVHSIIYNSLNCT
jgi:dipeptide/tripeptide permease